LKVRTLLAWLAISLVVGGLIGGCAGRSAAAAGAGASRTRAVQNKGSDTMVNLALAWAEAYRKVKPDLDIAVTGGGSGTGIAALINGTVDIANASRAMKDNEIADAQKNGINPVEHTVAVDALAIIVNKQNPVSQLTIDQLSDIFTGRATNWQDVGGDDAPIVLVSRETNSGTHVYFLEEVVRKGDKENKDVFAPQTLLMPSSVGITSEVQRNPHAIGYDGLGYVDTETEKLIAVATDAGSPYVLPSVETGADGTYPISRDLYMYTTGVPNADIDDYLAWIRGPDGQEIVANLGFVPIPQE
jgi:phosphate transport system substrate-binding protein